LENLLILLQQIIELMDFNLLDAYNAKNLTETWYLLGERVNA